MFNTSVVNGFHHVSIQCRDYDRSLRFYQEALGLKEVIGWGEAPGRAIMLDAGDGCCVELFERPTGGWSQEKGCLQHFALKTNDCAAATERARAAGAPVIVEPKDVELSARPKPLKVRIAFCKGPDGEEIEFLQER